MANPYEILFPFACFECRRAFRRGNRPSVEARPCPACGGTAFRLNRKFKTPRRNDIKQWQKVRFLYEQGFRFQSVPRVDGKVIRYPKTLAEARLFVQRFPDRAVWQRVYFLYSRGFRLQSVPNADGRAASYPETLAEAKLFVQRFRDHSLKS